MIRFFKIPVAVILAWAVVLPGLNAREIRLSYRLKWLFNASVAGDILAREKGYFRQAGLDVNVKEGSPEKDAIKELELGYADFGVASADQVIRALAKGADVVVLAQIFQVNPMQWIYRADRPEILTLKDLEGRRIGITYGGNDETIMKALLALSGLEPGDVKIFGVRFDFTPFLKKKVEIWPVYRNSQGVILEDKLAREGELVRFLNPAGFGIRFVANSVVTSGKMMKESPLVAEAFMTSLMKAWEDAMDPANENMILGEIMKKDKTATEDILRKQVSVTRDLVRPDSEIPMGRIDIQAWQQTEEIMLREKLIPGPVHVETRLVETGVSP
ncbi:ABC transporter substrate-binding protein [Desulfospira joergensenii]|uniref:ABC transporter substrate-binding protein n=1 Tax=Desulfospira joergensenii TaxID=53329 RepID=UPI0003B389AA|nr:ABC transporter substrate-binding protein [Desulfospira joergensenii]